jgi:hypothetical protein
MSSSHRTTTLGLLLWALLPAFAGAQGVVRPAPRARIGVTLPPSLAGGMRGSGHGGSWQGRADHGGRQRFPDHRFGRGFSFPLIVTTPFESSPTAAAAQPVPYYYPVPVPAYSASPRPEPEKRALPPYNPANSRSVIIGAGADGGGGVMRIAQRSSDTLQITWLGTTRPTRRVTLFLADEMHLPLKTRVIGLDHREVLFALTSLERPAVYAGLSVVFADGSTQTTLVPLAEAGRQ